MNNTVLETTSNVAVDIPRLAGDNETQTVVNNPQNGQVIVQANGTLTYTPNNGFEGEDSFDVQVCDVNQACEVIVLTVVIVQPISNKSSSSDSWTSSNLAYSLALLALVPIVALAIVYAQRAQQRNDQEQGKPTVVGTLKIDQPTPSVDVEPSFNPRSSALPEVHPATATSDSTTASDNLEAANDSPNERPVRQVTYQEVDRQVQQVSALSVIDEQRPLFKQDDPPSIHDIDNANPHRFLPDHKDQCRSVLPANRPKPPPPLSRDTPIAEAVLVDIKPPAYQYEERQIEL